MKLSNCCYAPPIYELDDNLGHCSECNRGSVFEEEDEAPPKSEWKNISIKTGEHLDNSIKKEEN